MRAKEEPGSTRMFEHPACNWWIDEPFLLATSNPGHGDLDALWRQGFRVLISLLEEPAESCAYDKKSAEARGWSLHSIPIREGFAPSVEQMKQYVTLVARAQTAGKVVTHCQSGLGRSAVMAVAYWIARGRTDADAIQYVGCATKDRGWLTDERRAALEKLQLRHRQ